MSIIGIPIGMYGYIFPGNINLMVLDLYSSKKYRVLAAMLIFIVIFESLYCVLTLLLLNSIKQDSYWFKWLETCSFILILGMGIWMLLENSKRKQVVQKNTLYRGIISVVIHPQQIPFWLVIAVVINPLMKFGTSVFALAGFVIFNAIGTLLAMGLYMFFGSKILQYFQLNLSIINKVMGSVYILVALYYLLSLVTSFLK